MEMSSFAQTIFARTYARHPEETWSECAARVSKAVAFYPRQEQQFFEIINEKIFMPGGRYLFTAGRPIFQNANCFGFVAQDSREGWAQLLHDATMCLSMGGGVGVNYSSIRPNGSPVGRMGGTSSGPIALMQMVNEVGRHVMSGGARRSAIWAGLEWRHGDILDFITIKDWDHQIKALKASKYEYPAPLDMTNVSVIIDDDYIQQLHKGNPKTTAFHQTICDYMARTGEPAFRNQSLILREDPGAVTGNPCQEAILHHNDSCNLGSIVLPRIRGLAHLEYVTQLAIQFLYNGSIKGDYPTQGIAETVGKNRRIGLGLMGLHEYMLLMGHRYEWFPELEQMLTTWKDVSNDEAQRYARMRGGPIPITKRAIAPTGTISIIAETTSGIEPLFCTAYKRRYLKGDKHYFQYVVDPTAQRLISAGMPPAQIEDAYQLAHDFERRLAVQAHVQEYVDQAISSTVNLPAYGEPGNTNSGELATTIAKYLPALKGLTLYPDSARSGQPLSPVDFSEAMAHTGVVFEEDGDHCINGVCGL